MHMVIDNVHHTCQQIVYLHPIHSLVHIIATIVKLYIKHEYLRYAIGSILIMSIVSYEKYYVSTLNLLTCIFMFFISKSQSEILQKKI